MTPEQVHQMLMYVKAAEPYTVVDESAVAFWSDALIDAIPDDFARSAIAKHYAEHSADRLTPGHLNRYWRAHRLEKQIGSGGGSCGRSECRCTHTHCDHGFLDSTILPDAVTPCPQCKPETLAFLNDIPTPGKREPWQMSYVSDQHRKKREMA